MTGVSDGYLEYLAQHGAIEIAKAHDPLDWTKLDPYFPYMSPSRLSMARRCPYQLQQRYILGLKSPPGQAPVIGTAVHAGLERNFEQKIESHEDLPTHELLDWYSDVGFDTVVAIEEESSQCEVFWESADGSPEPAKIRGRVILGEYHNAVSPRIQPIETEGSFSIDLGLPVPVVGRYDLVREESVIDVKTGSRSNRKPKGEWLLQGGIYSAALSRPVEFHSATASKEKNLVTIVTPLESPEMLVAPNESEKVLLRENVRTIAAEICMYMELLGPEKPWPTYGRFHDWACGYCGYRRWCPAWESER